jgi:NAD(P)-dependent dehydrogenase (short-subunit alcohol dehydrogenase family)
MEIKGKNVLITGAGKRIGRNLAVNFAKEGANLILHYHSSEKEIKEVEDIVKSHQVKVLSLKADLTDMKDVYFLIKESLIFFRKVDILINNASVYYPTPLDTVKEKDLDLFYSIHVKAPFFLSKELGKVMYENKEGRIINIVDYAPLRPYKDFTPYAVSKGAMLTMTRAFAKEFAPYVLVNAVLPGPIIPAEDLDDLEKPLKKTLLKKWAGEKEVWKGVKYLIETDFTTGAFLPVEGGRLIC